MVISDSMPALPDEQRGFWSNAYLDVRQQSEALCAPLTREDHVIQTAPEASPAKWHLAHVSWFFETFLLKAYLPGYRPFHPLFGYLFNSYYEQIGKFHPPPGARAFCRAQASRTSSATGRMWTNRCWRCCSVPASDVGPALQQRWRSASTMSSSIRNCC